MIQTVNTLFCFVWVWYQSIVCLIFIIICISLVFQNYLTVSSNILTQDGRHTAAHISAWYSLICPIPSIQLACLIFLVPYLITIWEWYVTMVTKVRISSFRVWRRYGWNILCEHLKRHESFDISSDVMINGFVSLKSSSKCYKLEKPGNHHVSFWSPHCMCWWPSTVRCRTNGGKVIFNFAFCEAQAADNLIIRKVCTYVCMFIKLKSFRINDIAYIINTVKSLI